MIHAEHGDFATNTHKYVIRDFEALRYIIYIYHYKDTWLISKSL